MGRGSRLLVLGGSSGLLSSRGCWPTRQELSAPGLASSRLTAGGGGKTTLADRLCRVMAGAAVVHTDDLAWAHSRFAGTA
jgi:hypothetical protein